MIELDSSPSNFNYGIIPRFCTLVFSLHTFTRAGHDWQSLVGAGIAEGLGYAACQTNATRVQK